MPSSQERFVIHQRITSPEVLPVDLLHAATGLSRQNIKRAMQKGAVWVTRGRKTQRLRRAKRALQTGDELHFYYDPHVLDQQAVEPQLVADIGGYSVWNKPYGLRSQGSKWGDHCTVVRWAEQNLLPERPAFTVHRLDRAATGLILIAHSKSMAASLSRLFRDRQVTKRYRALVHGDFSSQARPKRISDDIDGKSAASEFTFLQFCNARSQSLLDISIETGRKHQIRRHLAAAGFPIVGDRLYGEASDSDADLQLNACELGFNCPVSGQQVSYRLPDGVDLKVSETAS